jgi:uroporphyrinogen decarboxylase
MNGERMTPSERWKALLNGDPVDRVPVFPISFGHTALINGYPNLGAYYEHPMVSYQCQKIGKELYGYEQPYVLIPSGAGAAEWGSKIFYPYNPKMGSVAVIDHVAKTADDVERLQVPDPKGMPNYQEFIETSKKIIAEKEMPLITSLGGWITNACMIASVETFMRWVVYEPGVAKKLLAKSRDYALRFVEQLVRDLGAGTFLLWDANPTDSNVLISSKTFEEFSLPNAIEVHQKALSMGVPMWWTHWCSNHMKNIKAGFIEKVPLGKPGIIHFGDEVDLKLVVERFGNRNIVMGNINPIPLLLRTHEECVQLAKQDIEKGKHSPRGYVLGAGCEFPPRAPPANVYALMKAAREYGKY